jgi:hypothetical protein
MLYAAARAAAREIAGTGAEIAVLKTVPTVQPASMQHERCINAAAVRKLRALLRRRSQRSTASSKGPWPAASSGAFPICESFHSGISEVSDPLNPAREQTGRGAA